jgi:perosamine synthetase
VRVDDRRVSGGSVGVAKVLKEHEIFAVPRYIQKPAFACQVFRDQQTFGRSRYPFTLARPQAVDYRRDRFPGTYDALDAILVIPWNDRYTQEHVEYIAQAMYSAADRLKVVA